MKLVTMQPRLLTKYREWGKYVSKWVMMCHNQRFPYMLHWKLHAWWRVIIAYNGPSWVIFKSCADNIFHLAWTDDDNFLWTINWLWHIIRISLTKWADDDSSRTSSDIWAGYDSSSDTLYNIQEIGMWLIILLYRQKDSSLPLFCQ